MAYHDFCDYLRELKATEMDTYSILLMWERVLAMLGWIMKSTKAEECQEEVDDFFHIFNYRNAVYGRIRGTSRTVGALNAYGYGLVTGRARTVHLPSNLRPSPYTVRCAALFTVSRASLASFLYRADRIRSGAFGGVENSEFTPPLLTLCVTFR